MLRLIDCLKSIGFIDLGSDSGCLASHRWLTHHRSNNWSWNRYANYHHFGSILDCQRGLIHHYFQVLHMPLIGSMRFNTRVWTSLPKACSSPKKTHLELAYPRSKFAIHQGNPCSSNSQYTHPIELLKQNHKKKGISSLQKVLRDCSVTRLIC
jgi:hypothetical protein